MIDSDHGETLYDHDCYFDHHGLYDCTLRVPLVFRLPGTVPAGQRFDDILPAARTSCRRSWTCCGIKTEHHVRRPQPGCR